MRKLSTFLSVNQILALTTAIATCAIVTHLQWNKMAEQKDGQRLSKSEYLKEEQDAATNIELLSKLPSLGFDNLIADAAFLSFVQYFGDDNARNVTGYSVTPKFFEVAVERDPLFLEMYPILSSTITLFSGNPTKSIELLDKGIQNIPEKLKSKAYFLHQAKATDELLFMGKPQAAEQSYRAAAEWVSKSPTEENQAIAQRSLQTAQFLSKNPDSRNAQINAWLNILGSSIDERTQTLAIRQIEQLGGTIEFMDGRINITFPDE
ncbi:MAG: hypothetical protein HC810_08755 [Acaryochloridaceae cyanobacterium RL_2_7]|nr:hypothetical protein [Acaryochloridaceae cyanobacterium RL_2_7]